ncbi:MAG TPA: LysM peptidoglycan-binding domain-containing protein [Anaerolineaceae bacterium]|nr:LysM peptidoglycan-binding domain-containing protein [Anaerolineaceae bacterium]
MNSPGNGKKSFISVLFLGLMLVAGACAIARPAELLLLPEKLPDTSEIIPTTTQRPIYRPGELVAYTAQSGDNLPMLAARFNTSEEAIRKVNTILPASLTTLPQGLPMQIPIYYTPFWGSVFRLIPNSAFVYSARSETSGMRTMSAVNVEESEVFQQLSGSNVFLERFGQICLEASIDPRLMLSLLAYGFEPDSGLQTASTVLLESISQQNLDLLLRWLGLLNEGFYGFESGRLLELELPDGTIERLDPWQNAGSAALRYFFSQMLETATDYQRAVAPGGFAAIYEKLYGNPWAAEFEVLPGSLEWIPAGLPINSRGGWQAAAFPEGILKSMPSSGVLAGFHANIQNAKDKNDYGKVFACIGGTITRLEPSQLVVSYEGTQESQGWSVVYYGVKVKPGLKVGDKVEIGESLGHVDSSGWNASFWLARKFNGEWVGANGVVPFNLGGWKLAMDSDGRNLTMQKPELTIYSQPSKSQINLIPNN